MSYKRQVQPERSKKNRFILFVKSFAIVCFFGLGTAILAAYLYIDIMRAKKGPHQETVLFDVPAGAGLMRIKHDLFRVGVISHPWQLHLAVMFATEDFLPK